MEGNRVMTTGSNAGLHLPSLTINGFRGIERLEIPTLGRVTLLAGKNGVGKTTVLDAVRIYAARGRLRVLSAVLEKHEEVAPAMDSDGDDLDTRDPAALFYGRRASRESAAEIGPANGSTGDRIRIGAGKPSDEARMLLRRAMHNFAPEDPLLAVDIAFGAYKRTLPWFFAPRSRSSRDIMFLPHAVGKDAGSDPPAELACQSLGPGIMDNDKIAELWDDVALTEGEEYVVRVMNLALNEKAERIAIVGYRKPGYRLARRRVVVKLRGSPARVPLRSLGDGAGRLFGLAIALFASRNGFLLIDEVENGLHHTVLYDLWRLIIQAAEENNVQVFATTHSFDSIGVFGYAAADCPDSEGVIARLERREGEHRAVMYSEAMAKTAAKQHIEVR